MEAGRKRTTTRRTTTRNRAGAVPPQLSQWHNFLRAFHAQHPHLSYQEAMKMASPLYHQQKTMSGYGRAPAKRVRRARGPGDAHVIAGARDPHVIAGYSDAHTIAGRKRRAPVRRVAGEEGGARRKAPVRRRVAGEEGGARRKAPTRRAKGIFGTVGNVVDHIFPW